MADSAREVRVHRTARGRYEAINARGGSLEFGSGDDSAFTPVELLLAALAGCSAVDLDEVVSRRGDPAAFDLRAGGTKTIDESGGNLLADLWLDAHVEPPAGVDAAVVQTLTLRTLRLSHDRLCTVSRTLEAGGRVRSSVSGTPLPGTD